VYLNTWISHVADGAIQISPLGMGRSRGVDGDIVTKIGIKEKEFEEMRVQYKVGEGGVSYFAKGFSPDVL
jgi:hypothetical protein